MSEEDGPAIVIEGTHNWPGGARTLIPCQRLEREPNRPHVYWFGAELDQDDGTEVHFRVTWESIQRMNEKTSRTRGARLIRELSAWMTSDRQLKPGINRFKTDIGDDGNVRIERVSD